MAIVYCGKIKFAEPNESNARAVKRRNEKRGGLAFSAMRCLCIEFARRNEVWLSMLKYATARKIAIINYMLRADCLICRLPLSEG